jgi:hypothetical protein
MLNEGTRLSISVGFAVTVLGGIIWLVLEWASLRDLPERVKALEEAQRQSSTSRHALCLTVSPSLTASRFRLNCSPDGLVTLIPVGSRGGSFYRIDPSIPFAPMSLQEDLLGEMIPQEEKETQVQSSSDSQK